MSPSLRNVAVPSTTSSGSWDVPSSPVSRRRVGSATSSPTTPNSMASDRAGACADAAASLSPENEPGVVMLLVPSVTDINGAGGVAARWREYARELERGGYAVELWTVDSQDPNTKIPRYRLANFPGTLTDSPGAGFVWKIWSRLTRHDELELDDTNQTTNKNVRAVIMTDLFSNVPLALLCAGAGVPLVYSIHTDIAQLDGINLLPSSAAFLQGCAGRLATVCVTTSQGFAKQLRARGIRWVRKHYRPLPVDAVARASRDATEAEVAEARREMCAGAVDRPLLAYVGRWSAEKRLHLLKQCRPAGVTLAFIGDGPMREVVEQWHDPPRVVVLPGMRPRDRLAVAYRAADWVVSASAFETFGNVPYEAAHCGTPALLQDAQGFNDQIDRETEDRGALLRFDAADGEKRVAAAMDRTAPLLADPERVRAAARAKSRDGVTVTEVLAEALEMDARGRTGDGGRASVRATSRRRLSCLALAFAWATCLAGVLAIMKVCMVGFMWIGVDFTAGMAHQRGAKKKWRARRSPSVADDLDALLAGDRGRGGEKHDASPASAAKAFSSPPSPARVLKPWAERGGGGGGDAAAGAFARKKGPTSAGLATGRRRATRM